MTALSRRAAIRTLAVFFVVATLTLPALGSRRINVRKLEQTVADIHGQADPEASRLLLSFELTERLSPAKLRQLMTLLPGRQSRQSLTAIADASTFLKLPADDLPALPALGKQAQAELLSHASAYVDKTLAQLPNFFATEAITLFEDNPPSSDGAHIRPYRPIHFQSRQNATVLYRGGKEVMETRAGEVVEKDQIVSAASGLLSSGEFGPVLSTVLTDAKKGKLAFSHWENTQASPMAVFQYSVARRDSHYRVKVDLASQSKPFQSRPGYRGDIGIDPATGTILRLSLRADMIDEEPLDVADLMAEYGPVSIGGIDYICPVRSVAIVVTRGMELGGTAPAATSACMTLHTSPSAAAPP